MPNARPNTAPATPAHATPTPAVPTPTTPAPTTPTPAAPAPPLTGGHIATTEARVACDGGGGVLGHPQVWLNLGAHGRIACPYCSCVFVLTLETAPNGDASETAAEDATPTTEAEDAPTDTAPASPRGAG